MSGCIEGKLDKCHIYDGSGLVTACSKDIFVLKLSEEGSSHLEKVVICTKSKSLADNQPIVSFTLFSSDETL